MSAEADTTRTQRESQLPPTAHRRDARSPLPVCGRLPRSASSDFVDSTRFYSSPELGRISSALLQREDCSRLGGTWRDFLLPTRRRRPPMSKPARYREPIQPRANALETSRGGARRNRKTRRHDRTGRPPKKHMRTQIEEAERRRMSHSRWWGSSNCG